MDLLLKFLRFGLVGASGAIIDFSVTWLCKELLKWNKFVANSLGFILSASSNYFLNRIWTFHSTSEAITEEYATFIAISIIGLALNNLIIFLLNDKAKLNFYLAKIFAIGLVMIWNFLANNYITFGR